MLLYDVGLGRSGVRKQASRFIGYAAGMRPTILALLLVLTSCQLLTRKNPPGPTVVLYGGVIYTEEGAPVAEAMALQEGRVLALGTNREMRAMRWKHTVEINLNGRVVYPGFADAHAHLVGVGLAAVRLDLVGTNSFDEVLDLVSARHLELEEGEWLEGRGWDQNDWEVQEFPNNAELSRRTPLRPVVLRRIDGHALIANSVAIDMAGVRRSTKDPEGGRIIRDENGDLTGVFIDTAQGLFSDIRSEPDAEAITEAVQVATALFHAQGITAVHDAGIGQATLDVLESLAAEGELQLRLHEMLDGSDEALLERHFAEGPRPDVAGDGTLAVSAIKLYADGALGSRGAAMLQPYSDDEHNHGLIITSPEEMRRVSQLALETGYQVCTHAIGDRGVRQTLDAYAAAFEMSDEEDLRFRIEHAQVVGEGDFARFASLGVIPSMQAQHQTSDMPWAEERVGAQRIRGAYAWRRFIDLGCIVPGGSDSPVERLDSVAQFVAAVKRQTLDGVPQDGWYPDEAMTRQEALRMLTTWPAQASFREHDLGKLLPGYRADLVVFNRDLLTVPDDELKDCHPVITIFAGKVVWRADESAGPVAVEPLIWR